MYGIITDIPYENTEFYIVDDDYQVIRISQYQQYQINHQMQIVILTNVTMKLMVMTLKIKRIH